MNRIKKLHGHRSLLDWEKNIIKAFLQYYNVFFSAQSGIERVRRLKDYCNGSWSQSDNDFEQFVLKYYNKPYYELRVIEELKDEYKVAVDFRDFTGHSSSTEDCMVVCQKGAYILYEVVLKIKKSDLDVHYDNETAHVKDYRILSDKLYEYCKG